MLLTQPPRRPEPNIAVAAMQPPGPRQTWTGRPARKRLLAWGLFGLVAPAVGLGAFQSWFAAGGVFAGAAFLVHEIIRDRLTVYRVIQGQLLIRSGVWRTVTKRYRIANIKEVEEGQVFPWNVAGLTNIVILMADGPADNPASLALTTVTLRHLAEPEGFFAAARDWIG